MKSKFVAILVALALLSCSKHEVTTKMSSDNTPEAESVLAEALRMMSEIYGPFYQSSIKRLHLP